MVGFFDYEVDTSSFLPSPIGFGIKVFAGILYAFSFYWAIANCLFEMYRLRCPMCNKRFLSYRNKWKYCPLCGGDLSTEMKSEKG